jgi:membrane associated rhomboid family serine protease
MGMADRSYGNSGSRFQFGGGGPLTPGIKLLLISMVSVFALEYVVALEFRQQGSAWIFSWFGLIPYAVVRGLRIWQPFTYLFLHDGLMHILVNMLVLWMFGRILEPVWGKRRFLNYFFICGIGAGLINVVAGTLPMAWGRAPSIVPTVGASGAIYGILIACAILFPDRKVWLIPLPITLSMRWYVAIMAGIELYSEFGSGGDNVSHISHLGGMLIGYIYLRRGSFFSGARNTVSDWKRKRNMRKFQVYMRDRRNDPPSPPDRWVN